MRIFPLVLIVAGSLWLAKSLGLIPVGMFPLIGSILLIAFGVALLFRKPRSCRGSWRSRGDGGGPGRAEPPSAGVV